MERPKSLQLAVILMYVGAAIAAIGILVSFTMTDELKEQVAEDQPELTADEIDTAVAIGQAIGVVAGVVGIGLWIWMAIMNGQGKTWARTVATVFGGLNLLFTTISFAMPSQATGLSIVLGIASMGLAAIILILLYQRDSSEYYRVMSTPHWGAYGPGARPPGY